MGHVKKTPLMIGRLCENEVGELKLWKALQVVIFAPVNPKVIVTKEVDLASESESNSLWQWCN